MDDPVLAVSTRQSVEQILAQGGVSDLFLDRRKGGSCDFAICVRSRRAESYKYPEALGSAFLIGRIAAVEPLPGPKRRAILRFSEYARIGILNFLQGWKNPVRYIPYDNVEEIIRSAKFEAMPAIEPAAASAETGSNNGWSAPGLARLNAAPLSIEDAIAERLRNIDVLTIQTAKEALAQALGVSPEQVEITIKG